MPKSMTNLIADARAAFAFLLCGFVLLKLFTDPAFDATKIGLVVVAVWGLIDRLLGSISARYTADADATKPALKTDSLPGVASAFMAAACIVALLSLGACSLLPKAASSATTAAPTPVSAQTVAAKVAADLSAALNEIKSIDAAVISDVDSPSGQALIGAVVKGVVAVTADVKAGSSKATDTSAALDALGGTLEAYSTLPTTSTELTQVAQLGAGVATDVATTAVPAVAQLVQAAKAKGLSTPVVIQKTAAAVDAVASL